MRRAWCRLRAMLRRWVGGAAKDDELGEELRAFVEQDAESKIRSGMTREDARRAALIELGGVEQVKERVREVAAGAQVEGVGRDVRYAMRSLRRAPWFSSSVIGNLSLGLAAMVVAFALINSELHRPPAGIHDPDRVVEIGLLETGLLTRPAAIALPDYSDVVRALREGMPSLEGLASFTESDVAVTLPQPRSVPAAFVSTNYFDVLGVRPEIGRTFAPEEGGAESPAAIISHALWMREFGGNRSVVGRPIQAGGQTFEVIGVTPRGFADIETGVELWLPIGFVNRVAMEDPERRGGRVIRYVGRMRDGLGVDRVETELGVVAGQLGVARPAGDLGAGRLVASKDDSTERIRVEVSGLGVDLADIAAEIAVVLALPFLVLAIACVNGANLLLVRASGRSREVAIRLALGASRLRVVRQLIIESLFLAIGAALLALPLAWLAMQLVTAFVTVPMPLDGTVVAGALAAAFLTALGFGLVPALTASGQRPSAALGTSPAGIGGTRSEARGRRVLVAGQIALSLGLLASGVQLASKLESVPPGTDPDRMLLASFDLAQLRFSSGESNAFYAALLDRASKLPGVEAAGLSGRDLLWTSGVGRFGNEVVLTGRDLFWTPDAQPLNWTIQDRLRRRFTVSGSAGGNFFRALGLDLLRGRDFAPADWRDIPEVAIVTERLASMIEGGAVLGRSLHVSTLPGAPEADVRIVGIVESPAELYGHDVAAIFFPSPYFPSQFQNGTARTLYVRAEGVADPLAPAIRDIVAQIDPRVPLLELATLDQKIRSDTKYQLHRVLAVAAAVLGVVALALASFGLYGVTSYSVAMRAREIAVRMALGARADRVVAMVLRQALALAAIGSALGALVALVAGYIIQKEVFGVAGVDMPSLGGSAALLTAVMLVASGLAAWRAARLDPNVVLREE
jgi:putative ABC transport system permease protein